MFYRIVILLWTFSLINFMKKGTKEVNDSFIRSFWIFLWMLKLRRIMKLLSNIAVTFNDWFWRQICENWFQWIILYKNSKAIFSPCLIISLYEIGKRNWVFFYKYEVNMKLYDTVIYIFDSDLVWRIKLIIIQS